MRLATAAQTKIMDKLVEKDFGLPGEAVMEVAGALAAREIEQSFFPELNKGRMVFVAGRGHNGGDALVTARHLHGSGFRDLMVVLLCPSDRKVAALTQRQLDRAKKFGLRILENPAPAELSRLLSEAALIVDGLLGVGLNKHLEAPLSDWVEAMNAARPPKVALDVPSGLHPDTGEVKGVCVRAVATLTLGLPKPGFFTGQGPSYCGRLRILPLGYPQRLIREVATTRFAFTEKLARRYLPRPATQANKSTQGFLQVFAGSEGMWGAGILASLAAYRTGAGYVQLTSLQDPTHIASSHPEIMTATVNLKDPVHPKAKALVIGPGLGVTSQTGELLKKIRSDCKLPVLLDADALGFVQDLGRLPANWVLTPHAGELARMLSVPVQDIEKDRIEFVQRAAEKFGCVVLLKGFRTLIAFESRVMVVLSGNSTLAKAGTGDVLSGMIGALLAQGLPSIQASGTGAYLHGRMADEWLKVGQDRLSMTAADLTELLPQLLSRLRGQSWAPL